jgi:hypothetical protein
MQIAEAQMNIPWQTLRRVAAFVIVTLAYLNAMEAALPAARKADRLASYVVCATNDYQQGACL